MEPSHHTWTKSELKNYSDVLSMALESATGARSPYRLQSPKWTVSVPQPAKLVQSPSLQYYLDMLVQNVNIEEFICKVDYCARMLCPC